MSKTETTHPVVPVSVEDVTSTWISIILGEKISDEGFKIETNVHKGSGFLSNMIRIKCKTDSKSFSLIVKLLPHDENLRKLVTSENYDKTEIRFYQEVVPDIVAICPELEKYLCRSFYGRIQNADPTIGQDYASVIVIEDLKPQGYYTINFAGKSTTEQIDEVVGFLAKFHFASMILEERKGKRLDTIYDFVQGNDDEKSSVFFEMSKKGFVEIDSVLAANGGDDKLREAMKKLASCSDIIIAKVKDQIKKFPCLIHGDLWPNNLLFNTNPAFHTKVIDWQLLGYRDPAIDLAVTIISSLSGDALTKENVDKLLKSYYKVLTQQLEAAGLPHLMTRDWEAFSKSFYTWSMAYVLLWCLMAHDPFSENYPGLVRIYDILLKDLNVTEFLLSQIEN